MQLSKNIQIPKRLKEGDIIGVVAPSGPVEPDRFSLGISVLEDMGFRVSVPEDLFKPERYLAGKDGHRAAYLERMFCDDAVDAIICARGGYGAMRILPLLNYSTIEKKPKMFIGFSDITALLTTLYAYSNMAVFHGPVVTALSDATDISKKNLHQTLTGGMENMTFQSKRPEILCPGKASGPIVGGNLTTLCHLIGTPFAPHYDNHLLFIEDVGEQAYRIDRMLTQMELSGCFNRVAGIVVGTFEGCEDLDAVYGRLTEIFMKYGIPVIAGFEIGHIAENITLPVGLVATLDDRNATLSYALV